MSPVRRFTSTIASRAENSRGSSRLGGKFVIPIAVLLLNLTCVFSQFPLAAAGEIVVLSLRDGRVLCGEVDERTDDAELWLHSAEPSILVQTSVPWTDLVTASVRGKSFSADAFRSAVPALKTPVPKAVLRLPAVTAESRSSRPTAIQVQTIDMTATLANWDRDAEPDGIELRVSPLSANGRAVPVEGMISVRLLGRRIVSNDRLESRSSLGFWSGGSAIRENWTAINADPYLTVGRWNERLRKSDLTEDGNFVLRLPFRNVHPDYNLDVALNGQVDAKLSVTGQSVYYATSPIQLRAFSPLREELQLNRQTRFFPDEFLGR